MYTRIPKPFKDSELTGLKVDIAWLNHQNTAPTPKDEKQPFNISLCVSGQNGEIWEINTAHNLYLPNENKASPMYIRMIFVANAITRKDGMRTMIPCQWQNTISAGLIKITFNSEKISNWNLSNSLRTSKVKFFPEPENSTRSNPVKQSVLTDTSNSTYQDNCSGRLIVSTKIMSYL